MPYAFSNLQSEIYNLKYSFVPFVTFVVKIAVPSSRRALPLSQQQVLQDKYEHDTNHQAVAYYHSY